MHPDLSYQERQFQKGLRQELVRRKSTGKKVLLMHHTSLPDAPSFFSSDLKRLKIFYTNIDQSLNKKDALET